jgi:hypothetical protein
MLETSRSFHRPLAAWPGVLVHLGGFIHILLVIAVVVILVRVSGRRPLG